MIYLAMLVSYINCVSLVSVGNFCDLTDLISDTSQTCKVTTGGIERKTCTVQRDIRDTKFMYQVGSMWIGK